MAYRIDKFGGWADVKPGLSKKELNELTQYDDLTRIQFSSPLDDNDYKNLESHVFAKRPDIALRAWHHLDGCNLDFLKWMPSVRKFSATSLFRANGLHYIASLPSLEELEIGVYHLDSFDFLVDVRAEIKKLAIEKTESKRLSLEILSRFKDIEVLYLEAQTKGIEVISLMKKLKDITLRSISCPDLNFLEGLNDIWSVDIKLGGIKDLSALTSLPKIKYLELWQVNKLSDISFISELISLQYLFLQSLKNVSTLPNFEKNINLRRIYLESMKGLTDMTSLKNAPVLEDFAYVVAGHQKVEDFIPLIENENVRNILIGIGGPRGAVLDKMLQTSNRKPYQYHPFEYR